MHGNVTASLYKLGIVVIGRNEGERLVRCLESLKGSGAAIVYVDSSSTDDSQDRAAALDASVVSLNTDVPFTAGRARNTGFARLLEIQPDVELVQFVDGDCILADSWMAFACEFLASHPQIAIVCGRRKERFPEHSIYNRLCDMEWNTPVGDAEACGGDFLVRAQSFREVGGFNDRLIAGEEPELCYRLRKRGWRIHRADAPMTFHDAAMNRAGQWFRRTMRAGYAYAAGGALHRRDGNGYCRKENLRIFFWAFGLPLLIAGSTAWLWPWGLVLLLAYPIQFCRVALSTRVTRPESPAAAYSFFTLIGKWPEFCGQILFAFRSLRSREQRIIEYK